MREMVWIGYKNEGKFYGTVFPKDHIRPCREFWNLTLAREPEELKWALEELMNLWPDGPEPLPNPKKIAEKLWKANGEKSAGNLEAYIYSCGFYSDKAFIKHEYDIKNQTWDGQKQLKTSGIINTDGLRLQDQQIFADTVCGNLNLFDCIENDTNIWGSWLKAKLLKLQQFNFSLYSTDDPELLQDFTSANAKPSITLGPGNNYLNHYKAEWPDNLEECAAQLLQNGEISLIRAKNDDNSLPAKLILAGLQLEADRHLKTQIPQYDPLTQADRTEIILDPYDALNVLARENSKYKMYLLDSYTLKKEEITALADRAVIRFDGKEIAKAPARQETTQQITH